MDSSIALILLQDGVVNGAIYALLGMALDQLAQCEAFIGRLVEHLRRG